MQTQIVIYNLSLKKSFIESLKIMIIYKINWTKIFVYIDDYIKQNKYNTNLLQSSSSSRY